MGWMSLSLRVRVLGAIAILLALGLIAIASWRHAQLKPGFAPGMKLELASPK